LWQLSYLSAAAIAQQLHLADSIVPFAELQTITPDGWKFAPINRPVDRSEIVRWGTWPGILKQQAVWLNDGSWLVGEIDDSNGSTLKIDNDWLELPPIDLSIVRGIVVNPPASFSKWLELQQQMLATEGGQDVVWMLNRQRVAGVVRWPNDPNQFQQLTLDSQNQVIAIDFDSVAAIVFSPTLVGPLPVAAKHTIGLSDGSMLRIASISVPDDRAVSIRLLADLELKSVDPPAGFASAVRYIAEGAPRVTFLSDLEPASYRNASETKLLWELGRDVDVSRQPLTYSGGIAAKGLALHSSSQVAYRWDGKPARLLAQVVLAPKHPQALVTPGSATCQVLVARGGKLETVEEFTLSRSVSETGAIDLKSKDGLKQAELELNAERLVDVDLTSAQLVVLIVEKGDYGQYGDQVFWLDARITKAR